jgi:hypothetical protein
MADETLYAVLLLSGYETITCTSEKLIGWVAHVSGAATLLIHRGEESFERPFASKNVLLCTAQHCFIPQSNLHANCSNL